MILQLQRDNRGYRVKEGCEGLAGDPHACVRLTPEQIIYTQGLQPKHLCYLVLVACGVMLT